MSSAGIELRTGRKWKVGKAVEVAVTPQTKGTGGHRGDGQSRPWIFPKDPDQPDQRRGNTLLDPGRGPSRCGGSAVVLRQQGVWTRWESARQRRISWSNILQQTSTGSVSWQAVHDALLSPATLHVWGKSETPSCLLGSGGSLEHLLSCRPKALADGRYRRRHDQVLKTIAESVASDIGSNKHHHAPKKAAPFIELEKPRAYQRVTTGPLHLILFYNVL